MREWPSRAQTAVLVWLLFGVLCLAVEVAGLVDGLALPVPLMITLVMARAVEGRLEPIARVLRTATLAAAVVSALGAVVVIRRRVALLELSPFTLAAVLGTFAALAVVMAWRPARVVLLRRLGLDPDSAVHVVSGAGFVVALLFTVASFIDLQGEPPQPLPLGLSDGLVALVGDGALALAGVGFLLTRGLRATADRLDLRPLGRWALLGALGIAALFHALVWVLERAEVLLLPNLAALEDRFDYEFVGVPPVVGGLLLSLGVGIGEEMLFRGAMQPRFGVVLTAVLFAMFHVQYQLPGIGMIFLVGLGMGLLKRRTSTTFTAAVHVLYDVGAFLLPDL